MEEKKKKVGFYLKDSTKNSIDHIRELGYSPNELLDNILLFNDDAVAYFLELYKRVNQDRLKDFRYLDSTAGIFAFSDEYASMIRKLPNKRMTEADIADFSVDLYEVEKRKEEAHLNKEALQFNCEKAIERSEKSVRAVAKLIDDFDELKRRISKLESRQ